MLDAAFKHSRDLRTSPPTVLPTLQFSSLRYSKMDQFQDGSGRPSSYAVVGHMPPFRRSGTLRAQFVQFSLILLPLTGVALTQAILISPRIGSVARIYAA